VSSVRQAYDPQRAGPRCLPMRQTSLRNPAERANYPKTSLPRSHREMMTDRLALQHLTHCSTPIDHHLQAIPVTACSLVTAHLQATPMAAYSLTTAHLQAIPMTACSLVTHHLQAIPMTACSLVTAHLQENQMTGRLVWADRLMEKQTMDYLFQPHLLDRQR
jgi:hypothetical protein